MGSRFHWHLSTWCLCTLLAQVAFCFRCTGQHRALISKRFANACVYLFEYLLVYAYAHAYVCVYVYVYAYTYVDVYVYVPSHIQSSQVFHYPKLCLSTAPSRRCADTYTNDGPTTRGCHFGSFSDFE